MTIREVLNTDWRVSWFKVEVWDEASGRTVCVYLIGKDVKPAKYAKFVCETAAGDIYKDGKIKITVIDKIIQFHQLPQKPQGKEMCVGILEKEITEGILELTVYHMYPSGCGSSDGMHGYMFGCFLTAPDELIRGLPCLDFVDY